ncbi:MAG: phosphate signaling complex protein PhoU [Myxococcales bacterium]|nr:phosphate signaling complex protein PhoU [Polyangiaceae bacterium]MCL4755682.1 phosphate signaling complex protein PhoU [Myxococcales bacterium]
MSTLQKHTDREYEAELETLKEKLLLMGARTEELISQAMRAFAERDADSARLTMRIDRQVDQLELDIDQLCLKILARRQPVASDLRLITTTMKLVTDLERIGDLGVNVCERVIELSAEPPLPATQSVTRIAEAALAMLHDSLDAFVAGNTELAEEVIERDGQVDSYYAQLFPELLQLMMKDSGSVFRATRLQSIAKYLERIADHATNIAEMVVFMVRGKDVRHAFALSRGDG